ncbi:MAG: glycosyltransferase [Chitinophagales bacterium]|nr:glycosyltransferase [Chitinophagales bacterium]
MGSVDVGYQEGIISTLIFDNIVNVSISIIIPNLNDAAALKDCLEGLEKQHFPREQLEVIVVDNGSTDNSAELARLYRTAWIVEKSVKSPYLCRNIGISQSKGELLMLIDSRCKPAQNLVSELLSTLFESGADLVLPKMSFSFDKTFKAAEYVDAFIFGDSSEVVENKISFSTRCFLCKREVFDSIGLFLPIRSGEDSRWSSIFFKKGKKAAYCSKTEIFYDAVDQNQLFRKAKRFAKAKKDLKKVQEGKVTLAWKLRFLHQFFPPNPISYYKRMQKKEFGLNCLENLKVYLLFWCFKSLRAFYIIR